MKGWRWTDLRVLLKAYAGSSIDKYFRYNAASLATSGSCLSANNRRSALNHRAKIGYTRSYAHQSSALTI